VIETLASLLCGLIKQIRCEARHGEQTNQRHPILPWIGTDQLAGRFARSWFNATVKRNVSCGSAKRISSLQLGPLKDETVAVIAR